MLQLSNSRASIARQCWKKYWWKYIQRLEPQVKPIRMTIGTVLHDAWDLFYKGEQDKKCAYYIKDTFDTVISNSGPHEAEDYTVAKYMALGMWIFNPLKKHAYQAIESEETFDVPLADGISYTGRVDGRIKDRNVWWVRELKTTTLNASQFEKRMSISSQITGYVWAMNKKGYNMAGALCDIARRSLLQKRVDETCHDYGKRIYLDYKRRPKFYFDRKYIYRNPDQLAMFEHDMRGLAKDIQSHIDKNDWYRNPDSCYVFNSECPYKRICFTDKPDELTLKLYYTSKQGV